MHKLNMYQVFTDFHLTPKDDESVFDIQNKGFCILEKGHLYDTCIL